MATNKIGLSGSPAAGLAVSSNSSFHAVVRILPMPQPLAMSQIDAFCHLIDDIADCTGWLAERLADLQRWRTDVAACYAGAAPSALAGLAAQIARFGLAQDDFNAIIDGVTMDVLADIRANALMAGCPPRLVATICRQGWFSRMGGGFGMMSGNPYCRLAHFNQKA